jgi:hypothetical protein
VSTLWELLRLASVHGRADFFPMRGLKGKDEAAFVPEY